MACKVNYGFLQICLYFCWCTASFNSSNNFKCKEKKTLKLDSTVTEPAHVFLLLLGQTKDNIAKNAITNESKVVRDDWQTGTAFRLTCYHTSGYSYPPIRWISNQWKQGLKIRWRSNDHIFRSQQEFIFEYVKQANLSHSFFCENQKTQQAAKVSEQDALLFLMKFSPSSFQVNATHMFAQCQNHKI